MAYEEDHTSWESAMTERRSPVEAPVRGLAIILLTASLATSAACTQETTYEPIRPGDDVLSTPPDGGGVDVIAPDTRVDGSADVVQDVSADAPQDVSTDAPQDVSADAVQDVSADAVQEVSSDSGPDGCIDGTVTPMVCPDGTEVPECVCQGGQWQCAPDPSALCLAPCDDGSTLTCRMMEPECAVDEVLAVIEGCYLCVDPDTCQPRPVSDQCDDGSDYLCDIIPPVCTDFEILAIQDSCVACVNPDTCRPWGEPGCRVDADCQEGEYCESCASGSCPMCEDCVPDCRPHPCATGESVLCDVVRPECGSQGVAIVKDGCWLCVDARTCEPNGANECENSGGVCTGFQDICPSGMMGGQSMGCPMGRSGMCCLPRPTVCDDGSSDLCEIVPPVCNDGEVLAIQNSCWACVNPATCLPWGEPGCRVDADCGPADFCDPCGTASCPLCRDCVAACVPHGCESEDVAMCNCLRPDCPDGAVSVIRDECWICVMPDSCAEVDGGC